MVTYSITHHSFQKRGKIWVSLTLLVSLLFCVVDDDDVVVVVAIDDSVVVVVDDDDDHHDHDGENKHHSMISVKATILLSLYH
jgi:hypothetical protein